MKGKNRNPLTDEELENLHPSFFSHGRLSEEEAARFDAIRARRMEKQRERLIKWATEQKRLLQELSDVGIKLDSVWDLVNRKVPYPQAVPILLRHLALPYSDHIREGIARSLAIPDAKDAWPIFVEEYRKAPEGVEDGIARGAKVGLACALNATVDSERMDELISLVKDKTLGETRVVLLHALRRSRLAVAKKALQEVADDPDFRRQFEAWEKGQR